MSGAEFIAVAGVISSIMAIVDGIKQVVDAAAEAEGLPKAFRQASAKLPVISDILEAAKDNFNAHNVSSVEKSGTLVVNSCRDKWNTLNDLFEKVIPEDKASRVERYHKGCQDFGQRRQSGKLDERDVGGYTALSLYQDDDYLEYRESYPASDGCTEREGPKGHH